MGKYTRPEWVGPQMTILQAIQPSFLPLLSHSSLWGPQTSGATTTRRQYEDERAPEPGAADQTFSIDCGSYAESCEHGQDPCSVTYLPTSNTAPYASKRCAISGFWIKGQKNPTPGELDVSSTGWFKEEWTSMPWAISNVRPTDFTYARETGGNCIVPFCLLCSSLQYGPYPDEVQRRGENAAGPPVHRVSLYCVTHSCCMLTMRVRKKIGGRIGKLRR